MIIADDEALARYAFRTLISKCFNSIQIVGEAEGGREAVELSRKLRPDIVIMDIKMPGVNGLDASREIINELPDTKILILTAYENFEYIQQALDIGVKGYLLKPLKKHEVMEKINKVLEDIHDCKSKVEIRDDANSEIKMVKPFIGKELVEAFITGDFDVDEVRHYTNFLQEKIDAGYFMLISLAQNCINNSDDNDRNKILRDKVLNVVARYLPFMKKCILGNPVGNAVVSFFSVDNMSPVHEAVKESMSVGEEIRRRVKVVTSLDIGIGIGNIYSGMENFKYSFDEANFAVQKAVEQNKVIHFLSVQNNHPAKNALEYPIKLESKFLEQIRTGNIDSARAIVNDLISFVFNSFHNFELIKEYMAEFITIFKRIISLMGLEICSFKNKGIFAELNNISEIDELKLWCKKTIYSMIEQVESFKNCKDGGVSQVYEFINRQFCRDITLEIVAKEVGLSPQYLSKLFKEEYGMNFIDYVIEKRINYAKELLRMEDKSIKEISDAVGYGNSNYFCRIFKKVTGLTPTQYMHKNGRG